MVPPLLMLPLLVLLLLLLLPLSPVAAPSPCCTHLNSAMGSHGSTDDTNTGPEAAHSHQTREVQSHQEILGFSPIETATVWVENGRAYGKFRRYYYA